MTKTTNYIYGRAAGNMHGHLSDAVRAGVITTKEAGGYNFAATKTMSGSRQVSKGIRESTQFRLDKFFKRDEIDYADFEIACREHSGIADVTVCCPERFEAGVRAYYLSDGTTVEIEFIGRFD